MDMSKFNAIIEQIDSAMNHWLRKNNFTARSEGLIDDFIWRYSTDTIGYTFLASQETDDAVKALFYEELDCHYDIGVFWMSWLHELGHSETWDMIKNTDFRSVPMDLDGYLHCYREIIASKWAVWYVNNHIDTLLELVREVDVLRHELYNLF